jgi:serine/threonine protein kinase
MVWNPEDRLFGGRYIVQKKLGQGGFGITYLVKDRRGQLFAVKTLKDEVMTDPNYEEYRDKYLRDFDREAVKLAICRHPHIVRVENHFYERPLPCLVMEYIKGQDLWQRINRGKNPLPEAEATRYIQQIGQALTVIHEKGLLHRDLKPHNIMVRTTANQQGSGEAVLIDFGIAREFIPDITQTHSAILTPGFAPLEQYDEQARRGEFTDVYALAATYYCLVTGRMPAAAFMRAVRDTLIPPQEVNRRIAVSDVASGAMLAGLQLQAEDRPQSVSEWLGLLRVDVDDLSSEKGVDYGRLRDLLKACEWKDADYETYLCMLKAAGQEEKGYLELEDIDNFPCTDLRTIDRLWVKYSNGRFGFSVQKRIYQELGGTREYDEKIWKAFGDRVGWRQGGEWMDYDDLRWDKNCGVTPLGHIPFFWGFRFSVWFLSVCGGARFVSLFSRAKTCNL